MLKLPFVTSVTILAAACASAGHRSARCELRAQDSTYATSAAVYRDCAVDRKAELTTTNIRPELGNSPPRPGCRAAEFEFVVSPVGTIELQTVRTVRSTDKEFADAVAATLSQFRFRPATVDGVAVRQIATYKSQVAVVRVAVPAGSPPPSGPPRGTPRPNC